MKDFGTMPVRDIMSKAKITIEVEGMAPVVMELCNYDITMKMNVQQPVPEGGICVGDKYAVIHGFIMDNKVLNDLYDNDRDHH